MSRLPRRNMLWQTVSPGNMFREIPTLRSAAHHDVAALPSLLTSFYINLSNRRNHILQPRQPLHYPPSWCARIYMCLYPMMTEGASPFMSDSSNQPDQPVDLLSHSLAPLSPNPTQSLLHLSIILSISFPMVVPSLGPE
jgi:hypothetical protein